ncbi:MAG: ribosome maturation factor RimP [Epsilonproteobacteria bacterium]|nr:ribosome maturation factor RimP [Campylobacterota bacterium]NPA56705.1 ribosome maturation factor RimP [Campylobacterota bacterium]
MALEDEIRRIVESCGLQLYDIETVSERGKRIYRVTIKSEDGVDLDQCAQISNLISPLLDVDPPISGEYNLEVSSPGVERKLKKPSHFQKSVGEKVRVTKVGGEVVAGELKGADGSGILITDRDGGEERIAYDEIQSARTYFEW